MRICIIEERYPPRSSGGASNYAKRSADALAQRGHEVTVITTKPYAGFHSLKPSTRTDGEVKVIEFVPLSIYDVYRAKDIPVIFKPLFYVINLWNPHQYLILRKLLRAEKPDIVHIHTIDGLSLSLFDAINSVGVASVITLHAYTLLCPKVTLMHEDGRICNTPNLLCRAYRALRKMILGTKRVVVVTPSRFVLDIFSKEGFFSHCRKAKLPLFLDSPSPSINGYHAIDDEKEFNILYVGRLGFHKGVHVVMSAFKELPHENVRLDVVGWGDYEEELRRIANGDGRIKFHGKVSEGEVWRLYASADVTVVPSICFENSPYVIYESLCAGTPVIASEIGGIPELVEEGYNGFLFPPGDTGSLERLLKHLIENPSLLDKLRQNARRSTLGYGVDDHVKKLEEIYAKAIAVQE